MKENIKIIFVDIDCTILNHEFYPPVFDFDSINALNEAQSKGILIFLSTARSYHGVKHTDLFDYLTPDGMILNNGGLIIINDQILFQNAIDEDVFTKICDETLKMNLNLEASEVYDQFLIAPKNELVEEFYNTYKGSIIPEVKDYHHKKVLNILLFAHPEDEEKVRQIIPDNLNIYRFHNAGVSISNSSNEKGDGVRYVLNYLKINKDEARAIGDDIADISMFKEVASSVSMENGKDEVKNHSSFITKHINNSGVKHALKVYKII